MPEAPAAPQASWEQLPEQSAAALRQALMHSLELENPNLDSPAALRAGVKEAIAKNKLQEVHTLLGEQISDANREELEALQGLLRQEAILYDFEVRKEKQMTPEEENKVIEFLSNHRIAIAVLAAGLLIGWQSAALLAIIGLPDLMKDLQKFFSSASSTVQGWWQGIQDWWSGSGGSEAAETQAGQTAEQIVQETEIPYEESVPNTSTPQNSTEFTPEPSPSPSDLPPEGVDPFETTETGAM